MKFNSKEDNIFFTSDTHFGHKNIIKYCDRPFKDVNEMDESLIMNWNNTVPLDGVVFHLGDLSFGNESYTTDIINRLNGKIILVDGNHDDIDTIKRIANQNPFKLTIANSIQDVDIIVEDEKLRFVLCHYAMCVWNKSHYGSIHLFGHSHGSLPDTDRRSMDVGVDTNNYTPYGLDDILTLIYKKSYVNTKGDRK